jgi:hypothetical protein
LLSNRLNKGLVLRQEGRVGRHSVVSLIIVCVVDHELSQVVGFWPPTTNNEG